MKIFFDLLPLLLFFGAYTWAGGHKELAAEWMTQYLGFLVSGGIVAAKEAPMLLSTVVMVACGVVQIAALKILRHKVDVMLWGTLIVGTVLGGVSMWLHSAIFFQWKPTVLYWLMSAGFLVAEIIMKRRVLHKMMGGQIDAPDAVWIKLGWAWVGFFAFMGVLNLYVVYNYTEEQWVSFKVWGASGLMLLFMLAQGLYLSRHMPPLPDDAPAKAK
ncbi:septation protein A [Aquabacterium sp.]|uniref:septation protein A n=1 Tax=Aquabacterium sp. TaxID=1872578 RepID=UPI0019C0B343|nr:septation protein A [Aquabacterium sp.]MBC7698812.1 septation protein A [Aquabacterium sp.]